MRPKVAGLALFLLSSSLLAFEIALLRVFSIESYHHFAYMAVGVALLGFGASGTALVLLRRFTQGREWSSFVFLLTLTPPVIMMAPVLGRGLRFDPTQLFWDPGEWWGLAAVFGVLSLPFLVGAAAVAVALQGTRERVGYLYAWNLAGSGAGALGVLPLLVRFRPDVALVWTAVPAILAALLVLLVGRPGHGRPSGFTGSRPKRLTAAFGMAVLAVLMLARSPTPFRVIHFKGLPQVEAYPDAQRVGEAWGPTGWAVAVEAPAFRHAPGLSLSYQGDLPSQVALFVDGEVVGMLPAGPTRPQELAFLDWLPTAAPYALGDAGSVLVLGSGGGMEVWAALRNGARGVMAVELVEPLTRLVREVAQETSSPYEDARVTLVNGDARSFAARTEDRFSLVFLPISGVFNATAAGIHSGGEDFLNTTDALRSFLSLLEPRGTLAVTHWTRVPPRDNVRVILSVADALRSLGDSDVGGQLAFIRSWATGTLLVRPDGFSEGDIRNIREFCERGLFDLDWPSSDEASGSGFNEIADPVFKDAISAASAGPESAREFARAYPFQVRPATDNRPYFGRFLRLRTIPALVGRERGEWLPFAEWGSLAVATTFIQSGILALLLMVLPVLALVFQRGGARPPLFRSAMYFGGIGFGFILVEMAAIQRLTLVLGHPIYAASCTLGALLVFSGVGSGLSDRCPGRWASPSCLAVSTLALLLALLVSAAPSVASLSLPVRASMALAVLAASGILMGMPFPLGVRRLARSEGGVAWAWAANGVASVLGASMAILLAMEAGSAAVFLGGALCYLVAFGAAQSPPRETQV